MRSAITRVAAAALAATLLVGNAAAVELERDDISNAPSIACEVASRHVQDQHLRHKLGTTAGCITLVRG